MVKRKKNSMKVLQNVKKTRVFLVEVIINKNFLTLLMGLFSLKIFYCSEVHQLFTFMLKINCLCRNATHNFLVCTNICVKNISNWATKFLSDFLSIKNIKNPFDRNEKLFPICIMSLLCSW